MILTITELENGIKKIALGGRMDMYGTQDIETRLTVAAAVEKANIILDLSDVEFMASIGMGVIIRAANALRMQEGKIVIFNPRPGVRDALEKTLIHTVIPVTDNLESAISLLQS